MHKAALLSLFQHDLLYVAGEKLKKPYWYTERKLNLSFITQYQHYIIPFIPLDIFISSPG